ncbi:Protein of unknown function [Gryllus bimaculatus]|nr:Protein of unknown function [Gryllus bimaculatus]
MDNRRDQGGAQGAASRWWRTRQRERVCEVQARGRRRGAPRRRKPARPGAAASPRATRAAALTRPSTGATRTSCRRRGWRRRRGRRSGGAPPKQPVAARPSASQGAAGAPPHRPPNSDLITILSSLRLVRAGDQPRPDEEADGGARRLRARRRSRRRRRRPRPCPPSLGGGGAAERQGRSRGREAGHPPRRPEAPKRLQDLRSNSFGRVHALAPRARRSSGAARRTAAGGSVGPARLVHSSHQPKRAASLGRRPAVRRAPARPGAGGGREQGPPVVVTYRRREGHVRQRPGPSAGGPGGGGRARAGWRSGQRRAWGCP